MARFDAKRLDSDILRILGVRWYPTYVIRNWLLQAHAGRWAGIETRHVLSACKRMERDGLISKYEPHHTCANSIAWQVTPQGQAAAADMPPDQGGE